MANPQKENGYTAIANDILEAFIRYKFPQNASVPQRLFLLVIRKTYGYQKKMDIISLSQFEKGINENNRSNIVHWLKFLVSAKILIRNEISPTQIEYGINKNYEEWLPLVQGLELVQRKYQTSAKARTETSAKARTHKRKKENTKETSEHSSQGIVSVIEAFSKINPACKRYYGNTTQRQACQDLINEFGLERIILIVEQTLPRTNKLKFFPTIDTPVQLREKFTKLESAIIRYQQDHKKSKVAFT